MNKERIELLNDLAVEINEGNRKRGFWDSFDKWKKNDETKTALINQSLMLVVSEIGEACESLRKERQAKMEDVLSTNEAKENEWKDSFESKIKDTFEDEIADSIIRLLDLAGGLEMDIGWHIMNKLRYNETRAKKHGKKF